MRPTPFTQLKNEFHFLEMMDTEITLDMDPAIVSTVSPVPQVTDFNRHFKWQDGTRLNPLVMTIKTKAFKLLYEVAFQSRTVGDSYLTGLRIYHGILENLSQELRFVPVYLELSGSKFLVHELGEYKYDPTPGKEVFIPCNDSGLDVDYRKNIRIDATGTGAFNKFDSGNDAESVTYPFQTLYTMILDSVSSKKDTVTITNALWKDKAGKIVFKHSFLLMCVSVTTQPLGILNFDGNYMNRSHLCPPCSYIQKADFDFA